jgi:hypothetical protein
MIRFTRTATIAPGKLSGAMAFAGKIAEHVKSTGVTLQVMTPVGGNPMRIAWTGTYDSLAALEAHQAKLMTDKAYLALITEAGQLFVAGMTHDDIWRSV